MPYILPTFQTPTAIPPMEWLHRWMVEYKMKLVGTILDLNKSVLIPTSKHDYAFRVEFDKSDNTTQRYTLWMRKNTTLREKKVKSIELAPHNQFLKVCFCMNEQNWLSVKLIFTNKFFGEVHQIRQIAKLGLN